MAYGRRSGYRRRLGRGYTGGYGSGVVAPFGVPLRPVPFKRKRKTPGTGAGAPTRTGRRVRRKIGSNTATMTKQRSIFGKARKLGDNSSVSFFSMGNRWSRLPGYLYKKVQGRQTILENLPLSVTSTQGRQETTVFSALNVTDLTRLQTIAQGGTTSEVGVNLFLGHVKHMITFKNQSNIAGKVTLYDIVPTKNPMNVAFDSPIELWDKGFSDMGVAAGAQRQFVGATPFRSAEFRQYMRVKRVTVVNVEPGQQHVHQVVHRVNRIVDSTKWANTSTQTIHGLTSFVMVVFHGGLAHESTNVNNITYSPMRLDYVRTLEYNIGFMQQNRPTYSLANNLLTTIVDLDAMVENQDVDGDPTNA